MWPRSGEQPPIVAGSKGGHVNTHNEAIHIHPHQHGKTMKVMVAIVGSELLLGVRRAPPTNLRTIHEDYPRGEPIEEALHLPLLHRTLPHDGTRQHKRVMEGKNAMGKIVADCRGGHAHIQGDGPDWQRPLVSPTQKNKSQKNHLSSRTYPAARAPQLIHLNRALQPRVHRPLHTLASQLHNRI